MPRSHRIPACEEETVRKIKIHNARSADASKQDTDREARRNYESGLEPSVEEHIESKF